MAQRKTRKEKIATAGQHLILEVEIGGKKFNFDADLFDLDSHNMGRLNDQISPIPSQIAYVGIALAEAERVLAEEETKFDLWLAEKMNRVRSQKDHVKAAAKTIEQLVIKSSASDYEKMRKRIREAALTVSILKAYKTGMDAKHGLSQTLSGNLRLELDALKGGKSL